MADRQQPGKIGEFERFVMVMPVAGTRAWKEEMLVFVRGDPRHSMPLANNPNSSSPAATHSGRRALRSRSHVVGTLFIALVARHEGFLR